jgi:hypothetical protein
MRAAHTGAAFRLPSRRAPAVRWLTIWPPPVERRRDQVVDERLILVGQPAFGLLDEQPKVRFGAIATPPTSPPHHGKTARSGLPYTDVSAIRVLSLWKLRVDDTGGSPPLRLVTDCRTDCRAATKRLPRFRSTRGLSAGSFSRFLNRVRRFDSCRGDSASSRRAGIQSMSSIVGACDAMTDAR